VGCGFGHGGGARENEGEEGDEEKDDDTAFPVVEESRDEQKDLEYAKAIQDKFFNTNKKPNTKKKS
jgi:hypothetical protein